jgi:transcription initiation factor TFIID subunit TAF12
MAVSILFAAWTFAQDTKTARITSQQSRPAQIDSVVDELQGIVVLCATQSESAEFKKQWRNYIRRHHISEADLGPLIFRVINDAEAYRGNQRMNRGDSPDASRDRRAKIYRNMHDTAMAVIRKIG